MAVELIATLASGLFAGAALYINVVEHPARMDCGATAALTEWRPSYGRATLMQAPLAAIAAVAGIAAWFMGASSWWMVGAVLMAAIIPFTLFVILPTNNYLLSAAADADTDLAAIYLARWNRLHAARTALSAVAFVVFLMLLAN